MIRRFVLIFFSVFISSFITGCSNGTTGELLDYGRIEHENNVLKKNMIKNIQEFNTLDDDAIFILAKLRDHRLFFDTLCKDFVLFCELEKLIQISDSSFFIGGNIFKESEKQSKLSSVDYVERFLEGKSKDGQKRVTQIYQKRVECLRDISHFKKYSDIIGLFLPLNLRSFNGKLMPYDITFYVNSETFIYNCIKIQSDILDLELIILRAATSNARASQDFKFFHC